MQLTTVDMQLVSAASDMHLMHDLGVPNTASEWAVVSLQYLTVHSYSQSDINIQLDIANMQGWLCHRGTILKTCNAAGHGDISSHRHELHSHAVLNAI